MEAGNNNHFIRNSNNYFIRHITIWNEGSTMLPSADPCAILSRVGQIQSCALSCMSTCHERVDAGGAGAVVAAAGP